MLFADAIRPTLMGMGFDQIQAVTRADEALEALAEAPADLVLVDIGLPDRSGLVLSQDILERWPDAKVVVLTALDDPRTVQQALRAGLHGYLTKDTPVALFASSLHSVLRGQGVFPNAHRTGRSRDPGQRDAELLAEQLTKRELDVLALLVRGAGGTAIADELGISPNTVRTHVQSILTKLQVHSRLEAATFAVRYGMVDVSRYRMAG